MLSSSYYTGFLGLRKKGVFLYLCEVCYNRLARSISMKKVY